MTSNPKKRKAAALEEPTKLANGHPSPSTDGHQDTPPLIGLDATEVPFKITCPAAPPKKGGVEDEEFGPLEEDGDYHQLQTTYTVRPGLKWANLKPYRNFIVADNKFSIGSFVYISHTRSPKNPNDYRFVQSAETMEPDFWVAKVLEVRAADQQHVYLRIFWLYWPDELPEGREPYHGHNEMVMSNHMDIIDAMTVSGAADVRQWHEKDEDEELPSLFFRQFYNVGAKQGLSELRKHCVCDDYYNPDTTLLRCNNKDCELWLHEQCLLDDVLERTYKRLVLNEPTELVDRTKTPTKGSSIVDPVKPGLLSSTAANIGDLISHPLKSLKGNMSPAPESKTEAVSDAHDSAKASTPSTSIATPVSNGKSTGKGSTSTLKGRPKPKRKSKRRKTGEPKFDRKKLQKYFKVTLESNDGSENNESGSTVFKVLVEDLRPGHQGESWKEDLYCLSCGKALD